MSSLHTLAGRLLPGLAAVLLSVAAGGRAEAQSQVPFSGRYFPLDHTAQPGKAGLWSMHSRRDAAFDRGWYQPVKVELAMDAKVGFYSGPAGQAATLPSPASAVLLVGRLYRLKISDIAGYPGVELFPTVELLDRLHPPAGKASLYPVPLTIVAEEIDAVLQGRLVTKVVYLEQPDAAYVGPSPEAVRNVRADPRNNAIAIADQLGRPMAILRIGGRVEASRGEEPSFYGSGTPVKFPGAGN